MKREQSDEGKIDLLRWSKIHDQLYQARVSEVVAMHWDPAVPLPPLPPPREKEGGDIIDTQKVQFFHNLHSQYTYFCHSIPVICFMWA